MTEKEMATKFDPKRSKKGATNGGSARFFKPSGDKGAPLLHRDPPPNVTGKLHLGHAWDTTYKILSFAKSGCRATTSCGCRGCTPGLPPAGQGGSPVGQQGVSRYDLVAKMVLSRFWDWKDEYAAIIHQQWAKMGISVDYDRERFTLDEGLNKAVRKVFVDLTTRV